MNEQRALRISAIRQAFAEGMRKYFPDREVVLSDDAVIDLFEMEILDAPEDSFIAFLESLSRS